MEKRRTQNTDHPSPSLPKGKGVGGRDSALKTPPPLWGGGKGVGWFAPLLLTPLFAFAAPPTNFKELVNVGLDNINVALFALLILAWFTVFAKIAGYIGAGGSGDEKKMSALQQTALFGVLGLAALLVYWGAAKIICLSLLGPGNCN